MVQHSTGAENDQLISGWISAVKLFRRHAGVAKPINEYDDTRGRAWIRYTLNSKLMNDRLLEWLSAGPAEYVMLQLLGKYLMVTYKLSLDREYFETYSFIRSQHNELLKSLLLAMKYIDFRLRLSSTTPLFIPNADNSMQMEPSRTNPDAGLAALLGASEVPDPLLPIPELETSEPSTTEPTNEAQPAALKSETEAEHRKRKKVKRKIIDLT